MYIAVVLLTMFVVPIGSIALQHASEPTLPLLMLAGRWFVFWGVGVRLLLAGLRQFFQASFTAREIFHLQGDEALPIVRELGVSNMAIGIVAIASLALATFTFPAAVYALPFYAVAGVMHVRQRQRSLNENVAMISDLLIALVLAAFVINQCAQLFA